MEHPVVSSIVLVCVLYNYIKYKYQLKHASDYKMSSFNLVFFHFNQNYFTSCANSEASIGITVINKKYNHWLKLFLKTS